MRVEFQKTLQGLTKLRSGYVCKGLDFPEKGHSEMFPESNVDRLPREGRDSTWGRALPKLSQKLFCKRPSTFPRTRVWLELTGSQQGRRGSSRGFWGGSGAEELESEVRDQVSPPHPSLASWERVFLQALCLQLVARPGLLMPPVLTHVRLPGPDWRRGWTPVPA